MPSFTFTSPDGKNYTVDGPDGATKEQAFGILQQKIKGGTKADTPASATPEKPLGSIPGGIGETAAYMATGMLAKPVSDIAGLAATGKEMISPGGGDPAAFKRHVQESLTYEPRTKIGSGLTSAASLSGELWGKGTKALGDVVRGSSGDATSFRGMAGNALEEAGNQAPNFIGAKLGKKAEIGLPPKAAALAAERSANAVTDATREVSQKAGYITPPEHGVKAAAAGLAGESKVGKVISAKNADNATARLGKEVGAPADAPLSKEVRDNLKQGAYDKYSAMEAAAGPRLIPSREFRNVFRDTVKRMNDDIEVNPVANKHLVPARDLLKSIAEQPNFKTPNTLRMIKSQRAEAKTAFRNGDTTMGTAHLAVAEQLENLFQDNLAKIGQEGLVEGFKTARVNLAKLNLLDRVVNDATGKVDLSKLAALSETKAYKNVLTGEFKTAADFAKAYRKAAQKTTGEAIPRLGVFDLMFGAGSIASGSLPAMAAAAGEMGTRVGVPALAERGMLQNRTPSYQVGPGARALPGALTAGGIAVGQGAQQIPQPPQ
jgi:hypothetical protein